VSSWVIGRPPIVSPTHSSSSESSEQIIAQVSWSLPVITGSKDWFFPTSTHQLCWTEPFWGKKKRWIFFWQQSPESLIRQSRSHERLWRVFAKFHRKVIHRNWPNSVSGRKGCQSFDGLEKRDAVDRSIRKMNQENIREHTVFKIHPEKSRGKQVLSTNYNFSYTIIFKYDITRQTLSNLTVLLVVPRRRETLQSLSQIHPLWSPHSHVSIDEDKDLPRSGPPCEGTHVIPIDTGHRGSFPSFQPSSRKVQDWS